MPFTLLLSFAKHLLAIFSPTKAQQFIADASSFSLEPNHDPLFLFLPSFSRFSCFSFSIFFFFFFFFSSLSNSGFISWVFFVTNSREDARCAGREAQSQNPSLSPPVIFESWNETREGKASQVRSENPSSATTFSSEKVNERGMDERMEKGEGWNLYSLRRKYLRTFSFF